jgi:hypothetical protein
MPAFVAFMVSSELVERSNPEGFVPAGADFGHFTLLLTLRSAPWRASQGVGDRTDGVRTLRTDHRDWPPPFETVAARPPQGKEGNEQLIPLGLAPAAVQRFVVRPFDKLRAHHEALSMLSG